MDAKILNWILTIVAAFWIIFILGSILFPIIFAGIFLVLVFGGILITVGATAYYLSKPIPPVSNRNPKIKIREVK
jgi:hypothetical protein